MSNPAHHDSGSDDVINRAAKRIVELGDGWMAAGLSDAPEEYARQWQSIVDYAEANGHDPDDVHTTFQVTMTIDDDTDAADEDGRVHPDVLPTALQGQGPSRMGTKR
ncbi:LLM class flavin-dependent oxidoreductase [Natrialba swarupiae]|nr:LLM class flavin-dependent oxidoreductase [Natrialba swarupiae]